MKIPFEDGSFIHIEKSVRDDKLVTFTMCGLKNDGRSLTMSSSELNHEQIVEIIEFLTVALKKD